MSWLKLPCVNNRVFHVILKTFSEDVQENNLYVAHSRVENWRRFTDTTQHLHFINFFKLTSRRCGATLSFILYFSLVLSR